MTHEIRGFERAHFSVIRDEVDILKPDIIVFLTGKRDDDIRYNFKGVEMTENPVSGKRSYQWAEVKFKDLSCRAVRLYHPSYYGGFHTVKHEALKNLI